MAQLELQRQHSYVAKAFDPGRFPEHKLAENQRPTKENQALYAAASE